MCPGAHGHLLLFMAPHYFLQAFPIQVGGLLEAILSPSWTPIFWHPNLAFLRLFFPTGVLPEVSTIHQLRFYQHPNDVS